MALYQKYRPTQFSEVVGQDHVSRVLLEAVKNGRLTHAYLLTGPRGTGKTTTARLLAKAINCPNVLIEDKSTGKEPGEPCNTCDICQNIARGRALDVIEIDAASHTGVEDIRDMIEKAQMAPTVAKKKVYIIDEVHMLSKSAFNALLKTLEEPPSHVVFVLATTEIQKLPATIVSRAQRYDFHRASRDDLIKKLKQVAIAEKIETEDKALELIAIAAHGGFRDAVTLFEQVASSANKITQKEVENILGLAGSEEVLKLVGAIFDKKAEEGLKIVHRLYDEGTEIPELFHQTIEILRRIVLYKIAGSHLIETTEDQGKEIVGLSEKLTSEEINNLLRTFVENGQFQKEATTPVLPLEMAIVESVALLGGTARKGSSGLVQDEPRTSSNAEPVRGQPVSDVAVPAIVKKDISVPAGQREVAKEIEIKAVSREATKPMISEPVSQVEIMQAAALAPVLEMKPDVWLQVVDFTKKHNTTLAALLRDAKPMSMTGNSITLGVKFKFHKDRISEVKNRQILEKTLKEITGVDYVIICELIDAHPPKKGSATDDELQKAVGEVFEIAS